MWNETCGTFIAYRTMHRDYSYAFDHTLYMEYQNNFQFKMVCIHNMIHIVDCLMLLCVCAPEFMRINV